jgi:hypothetical protein
MRKVIPLFWEEPAVALGVMVAASIAILKVLDGGALTAADVIAIVAPFGTAAGIRPFVTPVRAGQSKPATA